MGEHEETTTTETTTTHVEEAKLADPKEEHRVDLNQPDTVVTETTKVVEENPND